jgi:hypothetical protein
VGFFVSDTAHVTENVFVEIADSLEAGHATQSHCYTS